MTPAQRLLFIVEGDPAVGNVRRLMMSYLGWTVRTFATATECVQALMKQEPDCIVSDLRPPAMNAVELRTVLRRCHIAVPVVAVANSLCPTVRVAARDAGFAQVLDGPCDAQQLETAIRRAIRRRC